VASLTIENYVKAIFQICAAQQGQPAATGKVAEALGVLPGTVTSMLKTLSEAGLATYVPYEGVNLTESGTLLAMRVIRRHRLIELFLARTLHLKWDEVHEEAENLEHAVSDWLVDRMDAFLGHPETDPHGDPIPRADGSFRGGDTQGCSLAAVPTGQSFRLVRVLDQSPEFLRFLSETGLPLGTQGSVVANRPEAGVLTFRLGEQESTLALPLAEKLVVEVDGL
jgi:DtxR family transcriptional regulator, Mn-dependent transcriptional regulator